MFLKKFILLFKINFLYIFEDCFYVCFIILVYFQVKKPLKNNHEA